MEARSKSEMTLMTITYPFKNLVFHGGGIRAFAYHGALPVLEEYGTLPQIERVAGTSAGAMTAALVSVRLTAGETVDLFRSLDYSKISLLKTDVGSTLGLTPPQPIEEGLERIVSGLGALNRVVHKYGI
ncbi:patatin-like phospholipase family protein [Chloroflexi bacterium TSY]|nr:patatin-like phospholipase family protein [Chloroflexi bacterium TSY]